MKIGSFASRNLWLRTISKRPYFEQKCLINSNVLTFKGCTISRQCDNIYAIPLDSRKFNRYYSSTSNSTEVSNNSGSYLVDHDRLLSSSGSLVSRSSSLKDEQLYSLVRRLVEKNLAIQTWPNHIRSKVLTTITNKIQKCTTNSTRLTRFDNGGYLLKSLSILIGSSCNIHKELVNSGNVSLAGAIIKAIRFSSFNGDNSPTSASAGAQKFHRLAASLYSLSQLHLSWTLLPKEARDDLLHIIEIGLLDFIGSDEVFDKLSLPLDQVLDGIAKIEAVLPNRHLELLLDCLAVYLWRATDNNRYAGKRELIVRNVDESAIGKIGKILRVAVTNAPNGEKVTYEHHADLCSRLADYLYCTFNQFGGRLKADMVLPLLTHLSYLDFQVGNYKLIWKVFDASLVNSFVNDQSNNSDLSMGELVRRAVFDLHAVSPQIVTAPLMEYFNKAYAISTALEEIDLSQVTEKSAKEHVVSLASNALAAEVGLCKRHWSELSAQLQQQVLWSLEVTTLDFAKSENLTQRNELLKQVSKAMKSLVAAGFDFNTNQAIFCKMIACIADCKNVMAKQNKLMYIDFVQQFLSQLADSKMLWKDIPIEAQHDIIRILMDAINLVRGIPNSLYFQMLRSIAATEIILPASLMRTILKLTSIIFSKVEYFHVEKDQDWVGIVCSVFEVQMLASQNQNQNQGQDLGEGHDQDALTVTQFLESNYPNEGVAFTKAVTQYGINVARNVFDARALVLEQSFASLGLIAPKPLDSTSPLLFRELAYSSGSFYGKLFGELDICDKIDRYRMAESVKVQPSIASSSVPKRVGGL